MGSGLSIRRAGRNQHQSNTGSRQVQSSPPAYLPYYHPGGNYSQGYIQSDGQLVVNLQSSTYAHIISPPPATVPLSLPDIENHKANTIRNDVNLKKSTLRLERDEENPGFYLVAFSFDAVEPGWICIFFLAKEGEQCSLNPMQPDLYSPVRIPFEKGLGQNFRQACGTGVDLSLFKELELANEGKEEVFPLVVRTETIPTAPPLDHGQGRSEAPLNAPLPKWVHAQTTHAVLEKKEDDYEVKVAKQIIYVGGIRYELQEIYGIENADGTAEGVQGTDCGKECVICLSELRDTTVLPCRHMCMCSACAKVLRFQSSRCPICRTPVERLLEIKVANTEQDNAGDGDGDQVKPLD